MLTLYYDRYVRFQPQVKLLLWMLVGKVCKVVLSIFQLFTWNVFLVVVLSKRLCYVCYRLKEASYSRFFRQWFWCLLLVINDSSRTVSCLLASFASSTTGCSSESCCIGSCALIVLSSNELRSIRRKSNWTLCFIEYLIRKITGYYRIFILTSMNRQSLFFFKQEWNRESSTWFVWQRWMPVWVFRILLELIAVAWSWSILFLDLLSYLPLKCKSSRLLYFVFILPAFLLWILWILSRILYLCLSYCLLFHYCSFRPCSPTRWHPWCWKKSHSSTNWCLFLVLNLWCSIVSQRWFHLWAGRISLVSHATEGILKLTHHSTSSPWCWWVRMTTSASLLLYHQLIVLLLLLLIGGILCVLI